MIHVYLFCLVLLGDSLTDILIHYTKNNMIECQQQEFQDFQAIQGKGA